MHPNEQKMRDLQAELGYSEFFRLAKKLSRERLQVNKDDRPRASKYTASEYKRIYRLQRGICPWCNEEMALPRFFPGHLAMDHKNPNLTGEEFDAPANRQVLHGNGSKRNCNSEKNSKSMLEQSKSTGKTTMELI